MKVHYLLFLLFLNFSCSQNLDFNQIDNYTTTPEYTASLVYFTLESGDFYDESSATDLFEITDETDFQIFEYDYVRENLVQIAFMFEIKNEFNQGFTAEIKLLDAADILIYRFQDINILAGTSNFSREELIELHVTPTIINATKFKVTIKRNETVPIDINDVNVFEFKSALTAYLETSI